LGLWLGESARAISPTY